MTRRSRNTTSSQDSETIEIFSGFNTRPQTIEIHSAQYFSFQLCRFHISGIGMPERIDPFFADPVHGLARSLQARQGMQVLLNQSLGGPISQTSPIRSTRATSLPPRS